MKSLTEMQSNDLEFSRESREEAVFPHQLQVLFVAMVSCIVNSAVTL